MNKYLKKGASAVAMRSFKYNMLFCIKYLNKFRRIIAMVKFAYQNNV